MGGLTTAVFLAKAGKRVLVLEKHYVPGGFTHTFKRKKFEWDVGVHYVGQEGQREAQLEEGVWDGNAGQAEGREPEERRDPVERDDPQGAMPGEGKWAGRRAEVGR